MRKLLVKHFVFGTWMILFGKQLHMLRAARILFPAFCITGSVITFYDPTSWTLEWFDIVLLIILALLVWIGFGFFNWGYFRLFPFTYDELDYEQKYDYLTMKQKGLLKKDGKFDTNLTEEELQDLNLIKLLYADEIDKVRFYQIHNLAGLVIGVASVVIGFIISKI